MFINDLHLSVLRYICTHTYVVGGLRKNIKFFLSWACFILKAKLYMYIYIFFRTLMLSVDVRKFSSRLFSWSDEMGCETETYPTLYNFYSQTLFLEEKSRASF